MQLIHEEDKVDDDFQPEEKTKDKTTKTLKLQEWVTEPTNKDRMTHQDCRSG